jgi:hypothetical protein
MQPAKSATTNANNFIGPVYPTTRVVGGRATRLLRWLRVDQNCNQNYLAHLQAFKHAESHTEWIIRLTYVSETCSGTPTES